MEEEKKVIKKKKTVNKKSGSSKSVSITVKRKELKEKEENLNKLEEELKRKISSIEKREEDLKNKEEITDRELVSLKNRKRDNKNVSFSVIEVIVIIVVTMLVVGVCSSLIVYSNYDKLSKNYSVSDDNDLKEFEDAYKDIINNYVESVDKDSLLDAAIQGMYSYLGDEYSVYVDESTNSTFTERLNGEYEGIGIEITSNSDGQIIISRIFSDTPAEKSGLKAGDIIIGLDDEDLTGMDQEYLSNKIKTSEKSEFTIKYVRDGETYTTTVNRQKVVIDSVSSSTYDNIGYIKVETFSATTSSQFSNAINSFSNDVNKLIIDLRDNSGGYLTSAFDMSCLLTGKGNIVYQLKDKDGNITNKTCSSNPIREFEDIAILVNSNTASASEIFTLCLKENNNALVVGTLTFGKGTVQEMKQLSSGAMVKYTSSYWLSPNGNSINKVGIEPDIVIPADLNSSEDVQLNKALDTLK